MKKIAITAAFFAALLSSFSVFAQESWYMDTN